jgi:hypothetical protein
MIRKVEEIYKKAYEALDYRYQRGQFINGNKS